jgi:hypothetical protein
MIIVPVILVWYNFVNTSTKSLQKKFNTGDTSTI